MFRALLVVIVMIQLTGCKKLLGGGWDGKTRLICGGNQEITLEKMKVDFKGGEEALTVGGNCKLMLIDCDITAPTVISGGGNAQVTIKGGTITGTNKAISIGGNAVVDVQGAKVVGKIDRGGSAKVLGIAAEEKKQAVEGLSRKFGKGACKGVLECYQKVNAFGQLNGRLNAKVGADGKASGATYKGSAAAPVKDCLIKLMNSKQVAGYDGKPGTLSCEWAGTVTKGTQMMSWNPAFQRPSEGK